MKILNLGCGTKTSARPEVTNIDWSISLRIKRNPLFRAAAPILVRGKRREKFDSLPGNIMVHNLAKGIPFDANSVDVVYHSHVLEHLDRDVARQFLTEIRRVLKPGGLLRIVVPDLERDCQDYLAHIAVAEKDPQEAAKHDSYISTILEQSIRREASGTSHQKPLRRKVENALLGDARKRGETHQWMYDRVSLSTLLLSLDYSKTQQQTFKTSLIPNWEQYGLDTDEHGNEYKVRSLYMEAQK